MFSSSTTASHPSRVYVDPFKISTFTFKKVANATLSFTVAGVPSALYTGVVAAELPEFLNMHASSLAKITLGSITIFGNTVCNTQQIYDTAMHLLANRAHPHQEAVTSSLKYKVAVAVSAISGAGVVAFIAGVQLQQKYPNYFILVPPAAAAAGAEFFLGGIPLHNVMFKQVPQIFFGSRVPVTYTFSHNNDLRPLLENGTDVSVNYGSVANDANDFLTIPNQELEVVFTKTAKILRNLDKNEKNTLMKLHTHLYSHARSNFQENPGLLFSTLLFGKIDKSHPLFKDKTDFSRKEIVKLLSDPQISTLLKKLRTQIAKIDLPKILSNKERWRLGLLMGAITFTCFSYLYDVSINLIKMLNSVPGGVALSLLGFPGFIMMCGLGVNLSRIMLEKWDQTKWSEIPWAKVSAGILTGLAAAFLEATLCANMANHINGLNWVFGIIGLITKGVVINAPYAYRFIDASLFTLKYLRHRIAPEKKPAPTPENVTAEILAYTELLEHNTMQISHADLETWHDATDTFTLDQDKQVTINPMPQLPVHVDFEIPQESWGKRVYNSIRSLAHSSTSPDIEAQSTYDDAQTSEQSWGNWLLGQARKPYERCGLVCPRPANRSHATLGV